MKKNVMKTKAMKAISKRVMTRAWEMKKADTENIWSLCLKFAWEEEKQSHNKKAKAAKTSKAAKVIDIENVKYDKENLSTLDRKSLIAIMKNIHVKGWYRIYDKATMIEKIVERAA